MVSFTSSKREAVGFGKICPEDRLSISRNLEIGARRNGMRSLLNVEVAVLNLAVFEGSEYGLHPERTIEITFSAAVHKPIAYSGRSPEQFHGRLPPVDIEQESAHTRCQ